MSATDEIQKMQEEHDKKIAALKARADLEQSHIDAIKDDQLRDLKLHGRQKAIDALLDLDEELFAFSDGKLYLRNIQSDFEIDVREHFEKGRMRSRGSRESKGIWYSLNTWGITGDHKTRNWKKPESAYKALKEIYAQHVSHKEAKEKLADFVTTGTAELNRRYPGLEVRRIGSWLEVEGPMGGNVMFEQDGEEFKVRHIDTKHQIDSEFKSQLADFILAGGK